MRQTTTYGMDLWEQGTRGTESPLKGRAKIVNMQTYSSGVLGPRPRYKYISSYTGSTQHIQSWSLQHAAYLNEPAHHVIACGTDGMKVFDFEDGTHYFTVSGSYQSYPWPLLNTQYAVHLLGGIPKLITLEEEGPGTPPYTPTNSSIDIATAYSYNTFMLKCAVLWQGRAWYIGNAYATGTDVNPISYRLHYSDLYDFDAFTDVGYFDLDHDRLEGMAVIDNELVVWSEHGDYTRLSAAGGPIEGTSVLPMVSGRIPGNETWRRPKSWTTVDGVVFFLSANSYPATVCALTLEGVDDKSLKHLEAEVYPVATLNPAGSSQNNVVFIPYRENNSVGVDGDFGPLYAYVFYDDAWWNEEIQAWGERGIEEDYLRGTAVGYDQVYDSSGIIAIFHEEETATSPATYTHWYTRDISLDRPSRSDDTWSNDTEEMRYDSTTNDETITTACYLPRIQAAATNEFVRVVKVTIDGQYWKNSGGNYPTVAVTVSVLDQEGTTHSFTSDLSAASLSNAEPGHVRITATFDSAPFTPWSEVHLTGIDSLALENVHVDYEVEDRSW